MNKLIVLSGTATETRRVDFHRSAGILFLTFFGLLIATYGNVVPAVAQSQPTAPQPSSTPASTPATTLSQKPEGRGTARAATGTIKGRVVSDDGRPAMNVSVIAQATTGTGTLKARRVDSDGRFVFDEMSPALYIILATAPGYIDPSFSTEPSQWPHHLTGAEVVITLIKGGVITGTVTNSKGEAVVGVPVHATLANGPPSSFVNFVSGGGISESDDRGVYRIYGLLPGQYTVSAGGSGQFGQFGSNGFDLDVPTYYPSSTRDTAVPVSVRSGDATTGIDIKYRGLEGHSISGVVLGKMQLAPPPAQLPSSSRTPEPLRPCPSQSRVLRMNAVPLASMASPMATTMSWLVFCLAQTRARC